MLTIIAFGLAFLSAIFGILVAYSVVCLIRRPLKADGKKYILGSGFFMGSLIFCGGQSIMLYSGFSLTFTGYLFLVSLAVAILTIGQLLYVQFLRIKSMNLYQIELSKSSSLDPDGK